MQPGTAANLPESFAVRLERGNFSFEGISVVWIQNGGFGPRQRQQRLWLFAVEIKTEGARLDINACDRDPEAFQENTDFPELPLHHSHLVPPLDSRTGKVIDFILAHGKSISPRA